MRLKSHSFPLFVAFAVALFAGPYLRSQTPTPIPVTGNTGIISGNPQAYTGVLIQLANCPTPASITGYQAIVQTAYQLQANSSGVVNGTIWPNDLITCNGTTGNSQYSLSYLVNGVPSGTAQCYQIVSTQGVWNLNAQQPIACAQTPPNPQDASYRNINSSGFFQGANGDFSGNLTIGGQVIPFPTSDNGEYVGIGSAGQLVPLSAPAGGVTEIIPGTNVTCTPNVGGVCVGNVTVNSTGVGGSVTPAAAYDIPYYSDANTIAGGSPAGGGIPYYSGTAPPNLATGAQISTALGSNQVQYAGAVEWESGVSGNMYLLGTGFPWLGGGYTGVESDESNTVYVDLATHMVHASGFTTTGPISGGSVTNTGAAAASGLDCLQIGTTGAESNTGAPCPIAYSATIGPLGGSPLSAGTCTSGSISVAGVTAGMPVFWATATGTFFESNLFSVEAESVSGQLKIQICNVTATSQTPPSTSFNVSAI